MFIKNLKVFIFIWLINETISSSKREDEAEEVSCLFESCSCINDDNHTLSVSCIYQPKVQAEDSLKRRVDSNKKTFSSIQVYNYNLEINNEDLFESLSIDYLIIGLKHTKFIRKDLFTRIVQLDHLLLYNLNDWQTGFLCELNQTKTLGIELSELTDFKFFQLKNEIKCLPQLTSIILSHNNFTHFNGDWLLNFKKIELLKLNNNKLRNIEFPNLKSLRYLILSNNRLESINNILFVNLENLELLDLFENSIKFIDPNAFMFSKNLVYLYLGRNYLDRIPNIFELNKLKILDIKNQHGFLKRLHANVFKRRLITANYDFMIYLDEQFSNESSNETRVNLAESNLRLVSNSFDFTFKSLSSLFQSYLNKTQPLFKLHKAELSTSSYLIYRFFSHQSLTVDKLNMYMNEYGLQFNYKLNRSNFNISVGKRLFECEKVLYFGEFSNQTELKCNRMLVPKVGSDDLASKRNRNSNILRNKSKDQLNGSNSRNYNFFVLFTIFSIRLMK
jgi:hypothetical protein